MDYTIHINDDEAMYVTLDFLFQYRGALAIQNKESNKKLIEALTIVIDKLES